MGLDLTWKEEDRIKFGNCGKDLETIVLVRLPESSGAINGGITSSLERDSHYAINNRNVLQDLELPKEQTGYAVEYTEMTKFLTRKETEERLRKGLEEQYKDDPNKKNVIESLVQSYFTPNTLFSIGTSFVNGMIIKNRQAEISIKKFVRWVSKEEYEKKAREAKKREAEGDKEVWTFDSWYHQLNGEQRKEKCSKCPLNTSLSTEGRNVGCFRGTSYSHVGEFLEHISDYGDFPLLKEQMHSDGEFKIEDLEQLNDEISRAKDILESTKTSAINLYNGEGKIIEIIPYATGYLYGNKMHGYGAGLERKKEAITVIFQGRSVFDLPVEVRKQIIDSSGLEGIVTVGNQIEKNQPRFYFTEIYRKGNTFFGKTKNGLSVELPPIKNKNGSQYTPFDGYDGDIARMKYAEVSAIESFGYLTNLLQKYMNIAKRFNISIEGG